MKDKIKELALANPTEEICGLVLSVGGQNEIHPCKNTSDDKSKFLINPLEYLAASEKGEVVGYFHSHPNTGKPTIYDKHVCVKSGLPSYIYSILEDKLYELDPNKTRDVFCSSFLVGVEDCFTIVRNYFLEELGVQISNVPRTEEYKKQTLFSDNFIREGFVRIANGPLKTIDFLKKHDLICFGNIGNPEPHHLGVYLGNNLILHHTKDGNPTQELNKLYRRITKYVLRHKTLYYN